MREGEGGGEPGGESGDRASPGKAATVSQVALQAAAAPGQPRGGAGSAAPLDQDLSVERRDIG